MTTEDRLRALWFDQPVQATPGFSIEAVLARDGRLLRQVAVRRWSETIAGAASIAALAVLGARVPELPLVQLACALLVAGEAVVIGGLWRSRPRPAPALTASTAEHLAHLRGELVRERDLLASFWRWYLAPVAPGLLLLAVAACGAIGIPPSITLHASVASLGLVYAVIVAVQKRRSRRLAQEIEALEAE